MSAPTLLKLKHDQIDEMIARTKACGPHLEPIMQALHLGVAWMVVQQHARPFRLPKDRKPVIAIVGDDLHEALGPDGFHKPSLRRLLRGAAGVAVISSGPETAAYQLAAAGAVLERRDVIVIETRIEQEIPWLEFVGKAAPRVPVLLSTVKGGTA